jgi:hypothetical protein
MSRDFVADHARDFTRSRASEHSATPILHHDTDFSSRDLDWDWGDRRSFRNSSIDRLVILSTSCTNPQKLVSLTEIVIGLSLPELDDRLAPRYERVLLRFVKAVRVALRQLPHNAVLCPLGLPGWLFGSPLPSPLLRSPVLIDVVSAAPSADERPLRVQIRLPTVDAVLGHRVLAYCAGPWLQ